MERWLSRLLGLQEGLLGNSSDWRVEFAISWLWVALFLVVLVVAVLWVYRRESGASSGPVRTLLVVLRSLAVGLILILLFEPILAVEKIEDKRPTVIFLVDDSMSMAIKGTEYAGAEKKLAVMRALAGNIALTSPEVTPALEDALRASSRYDLARRILESPQLGWVEKLKKTHRLRFFTTTSFQSVGEIGAQSGGIPSFPAAPEGRATRLGDALREIVQGSRGQYISGVVLLTDGQSNAGEDPVSVARFAGLRRPDAIPFFCVGLGSDEAQRDVEIVSVQAPPDVLKADQPFEIKATVRSKGLSGAPVKLVLYKGDERVDERVLTLSDALGGQLERFEEIPADVGVFPYTVRLEGVPEGDLISENNAATLTVRVTDQKFRVLYVEGWARFEYHRLEALLNRNEQIYEYSIYLLSADRQWPQPAHPETKRLNGFPSTYRELLDNYDLVIFGDVDPRHDYLPNGFDENIRKFVVEGGGAFVMIAGMFHAPQAYGGTAMEAILPVRNHSHDTTPQTYRDPFPVRLNTQIDHPLMQLADDPQVNTRLWDERFRPHWHWHAEDVKPLARALLLHANHQTEKGKPCPLMLLMSAGRGQSLFIGLDETWRWPRGIPEGDSHHPFNKFWNQTIKYLASDKLLRGGKSMILKFDRSAYTLGERVVVTLELLDASVPGFGAEIGEVSVQVLPPDRIGKTLNLRREPGTVNFVGTFPILQKGHHEMKVIARGGTETLAEATFDAKEYTAEFAAPQMNRVLLTEAAAASQGEFVELSRLWDVPDLVKSRTKQVTRPISNRLMDAPLIFIVFCTSIIAEWIIRKRCRMM